MADIAPTPTVSPQAGQPPVDPMLTGYLAENQRQTQTELEHHGQRAEAMQPVLDAEKKALDSPAPTQPKPVELPKAPTGPVVDAHDFQKFSLGMVALALIGGGLSKSHWMNAASSLDGAMKGYLAGSESLAKQKRDDFERNFKLAIEQESKQNKEYLDAISARDRTIKESLQQAEIIAAKYGMVDAQDAIRRRNMDDVFQAVTSRQDTLTRMQTMKTKMDDDVKNKTIAQWDRRAQAGEITPQQRDAAVNAINAGESPPPLESSGGLSKDQLGIAVESYLRTGKMPSLGMRNNGIRNQIMAGAEEEAKAMGMSPSDVVAAWGTRGADMAALSQVTRQQALVGGYEETAQKNINMLQEYSDKLPRSDYLQYFNEWLQYGRVKTGNVAADQFNAALEETLSEYAKVMGGGYGAGSSTEGAQARAHSLLGTATTPDQLNGVVDTMRRTMESRTQSIEDQKQKLIGSVKGQQKPAGGSGGNVMKFDAQGNQIQ